MNGVGRRRGTLRLIGGVAAGIVAAILVLGIAGLFARISGLRPWLSVLIGINGQIANVTLASLKIINPIDVAVLALTSLAFVGLWPGPGNPHKIWMSIAIVLPLVGIVVLFVTGLWGRSGLMSAGIVVSALMVGAGAWRFVGIVGLVANALLLIGDFGTVGSRSVAVAGIVVVGYALLTTWFAWMAARLLTAQQIQAVTGAMQQDGA